MGEAHVFDLDRSTQQAWDGFSLRLAEVLSMMDDESTLEISTLAGDDTQVPVLRFVGLPSQQLRAEASCNAMQADCSQLVEDQFEAMVELGWTPPAPQGSPGCSIFTTTAASEDTDALARLCVSTLRQIYGVEHPVFLTPDQLSDLLQPEVPATAGEYAGREMVAVLPADQRQLDQLIDDELAAVYGTHPFRDSEGDVAIRVGSTMIFVRSTPDMREIVLFSALVHDVSGRSRAAEVLNDLNVDSRYGRFALHRDRVFVQMSVPAYPFVPAHLHQALRTISQIADGIDDELATRLSGRTTFGTSGQ